MKNIHTYLQCGFVFNTMAICDVIYMLRVVWCVARVGRAPCTDVLYVDLVSYLAVLKHCHLFFFSG